MRCVVCNVSNFTMSQLCRVEDVKKAWFVLETCLPGKSGGWVNFPVTVFYQPDRPEGERYFGLFHQYDVLDLGLPPRLVICNASSVEGQEISGLLLPSGRIIYSRYRHDYYGEEGVAIDGGRDYVKVTGDAKVIPLRVRNGSLEAEEDGEWKQTVSALKTQSSRSSTSTEPGKSKSPASAETARSGSPFSFLGGLMAKIRRLTG